MDTVKLHTHGHPLHKGIGVSASCDWCRKRITKDEQIYYCTDGNCCVLFHPTCAKSSPEIEHSFHQKHPLKLLTSGPPDDSDGKCRLCEKVLGLLLYHCSICNISMDPVCAVNPPPREIDRPSSHPHPLTALSRQIYFTCDACGSIGDFCPYICLECQFTFHRECIYLPSDLKVIYHQHKLLLMDRLPYGKWPCRVCNEVLNLKYGAYCCKKGCHCYVAHSKCATREQIQDRRKPESELEETDSESEGPEELDDREICHFSHQKHHQRLSKETNVYNQSSLCQVCILPVLASQFYSCVQCNDFNLHKTCARLPRILLHALHHRELILHVDPIPDHSSYEGAFRCSACDRLCSGFQYRCCLNCDFKLDVQCAFVSESINLNERHAHPLCPTSCKGGQMVCKVCGKCSRFLLNCIDCPFILCFNCATLPQRIRYKHDKHPLTLHYCKDGNGSYWCEICEEEMDPKKWFYACDDCGVSLHVECGLGNSLYVKPGQSFRFKGFGFHVVLNNHASRPYCHVCNHRCQDTLIFKGIEEYYCSLSCIEFLFLNKFV